MKRKMPLDFFPYLYRRLVQHFRHNSIWDRYRAEGERNRRDAFFMLDELFMIMVQTLIWLELVANKEEMEWKCKAKNSFIFGF